jgi:hypothetical protein
MRNEGDYGDRGERGEDMEAAGGGEEADAE